MKVKIIDPSKDKRWDEFVLDHKFGSIYHHSCWKELIHRTYGHIPVYFVLEEDGGKLRAAMPFFMIRSWLTGTRLVSLPFSSFCDPLVNTQEEFATLLHASMAAMARFHASYLEIRTQKSYELCKSPELKEYFNYKSHILPLNSDLQTLRESFHKTSVQQRIRRAERNNVMVRVGTNDEDIRVFYRLHSLTRKKHGLPPRPYKFFRNMWHLMHSKGLVTLLLAEHDGRAAAGILLLKFKDRVYYEYVGTDKRFLRYNPNHILVWKAIEMAWEEGFRYFDFGVTPQKNTGLMDFKRKWGTEEHEMPYLYFPDVKGYKKSLGQNTENSCWLTRIGHTVYSELGRIAGRIFYKHLG